MRRLLKRAQRCWLHWIVTEIVVCLVAINAFSASSILCPLGRSSPVPYGEVSKGPTFDIATVSFTYEQSYSSIRDVDFRNIRYVEFNEKGGVASGKRLKNGHWFKQWEHPLASESVGLRSVFYLSPSTPSTQYALVRFGWEEIGGSTSQSEIFQLFELSGHRLRIVQDIDTDGHFSGPYSAFDEKTNTLYLRSAHYLPGDAHCCVSAVDVVTLHWNGSRFIQTELRTELSEYGKREGKILPAQTK
jgi:hypothetical protein